MGEENSFSYKAIRMIFESRTSLRFDVALRAYEVSVLGTNKEISTCSFSQYP